MSLLPAVSVVIPVYGVELYIERCARSLFEQTLENMEFIFVDDCSPDKSMDVLDRIIQDYPKRKEQVKIIHHPSNMGLPTARRTGIEAAKGEYIAHCDSDDWVNNMTYQLLYTFAKEKDLDIVKFDFCRTNLKKELPCVKIDENIFLDKSKLMNSLFSGYDLSSMVDKLVRRSVYNTHQIIYPNKNMWEDYVVTTQLLFHAEKIGYFNRILYYYFVNIGSISHKNVEQKLRDQKENVELIRSFLERMGIFEQYSKSFEVLKYKVRNEVLPLFDDKKYRKLWSAIYPELGMSFIFNKYLSNVDRIRYLLISLRLYSPVKKLKR